MAKPSSVEQGGPLCLAFANTHAERPGKEPTDLLTGYLHFVSWMRDAGALGDGDATRLAARGRSEAGAADVVVERARGLRLASHRLFAAVAADRPIEERDLDLLDREWREARGRLRLVRRGRRFSARFPPGSSDLARPLWTLADDAARLLLSDRLDRVKACQAPACTHLFLDTSRNRSRRWCDMSICGNRMKARRHYRRRRGSG